MNTIICPNIDDIHPNIKPFVTVGDKRLNFDELRIMFIRVTRLLLSGLSVYDHFNNSAYEFPENFPDIRFNWSEDKWDENKIYCNLYMYINDETYILSSFSGTHKDNPTISLFEKIFKQKINYAQNIQQAIMPYNSSDVIFELLEFISDYTTLELEID